MDDFQQDFMRKVHNPTVEGEVVGVSNKFGNPKKPIDKRWFIVGGLILILVVIFIVLLIISNSKNSNTQPQGGTAAAGKWACSDGSNITIDDDQKILWDSITGSITGEYSSAEGITFSQGGITGTISNGKITITDAANLITTSASGRLICERSEQ